MRRSIILIILLVMAVTVVPAHAAKGGQPRLPQGIKVTADNGDFLGILVNITSNISTGIGYYDTGITTYIPSVGKFLELRVGNDIASERTRVRLCYSEFGCTGTAYLCVWDGSSFFINNHPEFLMENHHTFYELVGDSITLPCKSYKNPDDDCLDLGTPPIEPPLAPLAPIEEVPVDFTYPIVTPLKFE